MEQSEFIDSIDSSRFALSVDGAGHLGVFVAIRLSLVAPGIERDALICPSCSFR
jgi:ABC-type maltose transport system permease subunit